MLKNVGRYNAYISAIAHYFPEKVVPNAHFESYLDTSDEWIVTRTGIRERRYEDRDKPTSYMATQAVKQLLKERGITAEDIELIIFCTVTPDMNYPSTASVLQNNIGAKKAWGFDLNAACSSFIFGLMTGVQFIESGTHSKVLVVGADKMSILANPNDRNNIILFGDAASAVLLEPTEDKTTGVLDAVLYMDGVGGQYLKQVAGGSAMPTTHETVDKGLQYIYQDGKAVFKEAVKGMADVSVEIMEKNNLQPEDVAYLVPHQANLRIISATADRMKISMDKVIVNINKYGNTTSATIPSCISEYYHQGKIKKGDNLVLSSFGAGFTWGSILIKWAI